MITLCQSGTYTLIETRKHVKVLYLGDDAYAWVASHRIGEMLISVRKQHKTDCVLSVGAYRLYAVTDEPEHTDLQHLELEVGAGRWQGYLLLTGLPGGQKTKVRIVPTLELVAGQERKPTVR